MTLAGKVNSMTMMRTRVMLAAFAAALWYSGNLYFGQPSSHQGNPAFAPKRQKLKGWQKQARQHGARK